MDGAQVRSMLLVLPMKGIGDMVLVLPSVESLRRQWPGALLQAVVGNQRALDLAVRLFPVDRVHLWSFDWMREPRRGLGLLAALRRSRIDTVIDFMYDHSTASALFAFLLGVPLTAGFACARRKLFFNLRVPPADASHIVDEWTRLASSLGAARLIEEPVIILRREEIDFAGRYLKQEGVRTGEPLVALHPGARDDLARLDKRWHWGRYRDLSRRLVERAGARIIVLGSEEEKDICGKVAAGAAEGIINACGSMGIIESLALIGVSDLFIGNNSGPLHMANALGVPTISFAGGVDLARWAPYGKTGKNRIMVAEPACDIGRCTECGMRGRKCLDAVSVEEVAGVALLHLDRQTHRRRDPLFSGKDGIRSF